MTQSRIQKFLANQGIASRRAIERMITAGEIKINNRIAVPGQKVSIQDKITVKGQLIKPIKLASRAVIVYHKTYQEICTRADDQHRPDVFRNLPNIHIGKWHMVGRLDFTTSGLLLFTNDGDLAYRLMHPKYHIDREYMARVYGRATEQAVQNMLSGVLLDQSKAGFTDIYPLKPEPGLYQWFNLVLQEGRKHAVKRIFATQGLQVTRLKRVRYGNIILNRKLKPGQWLQLNDKEMNDLAAIVELESKPVCKVL